jgi:hypothetical protein
MRISRLLSGCVLALVGCIGSFAAYAGSAVEYAYSARLAVSSLPDVAATVFRATVAEWRSLNALDVGPDVRGLQAVSNHFAQVGAPLDVAYPRMTS